MTEVLSPADIETLANLLAERVADRLAQRPRLVDRVELAEQLRVSVATIERGIRDGSIPPIRIGRRCLFDPAVVIATLQKQSEGGND